MTDNQAAPAVAGLRAPLRRDDITTNADNNTNDSNNSNNDN